MPHLDALSFVQGPAALKFLHYQEHKAHAGKVYVTQRATHRVHSTGPITHLAVLSNGNLVSGCMGGIVSMWEINTLHFMDALPTFYRPIQGLTPMPNNKLVVSVEGEVRIYGWYPSGFCKMYNIKIDGVFTLYLLPRGIFVTLCFRGHGMTNPIGTIFS